MTSQEMMRHPPLKPGYHFSNVAPLGELPDWQIAVTVAETTFLFGHEPSHLLAKQYRRSS